MYIFRILNI